MWTETWPTEPDKYWFYGWCFWKRERLPELHFVKVRSTRDGTPMYVTVGRFLFKGEGGYGMWQPVDLPELPELGNG